MRVRVVILGRPELEPAILESLTATGVGGAVPAFGSDRQLLIVGCDGRRDWGPYVERERIAGHLHPIVVVGHDRPCARCDAALNRGADAWIPDTPASLLPIQLKHIVRCLWRRASGEWPSGNARIRLDTKDFIAVFTDRTVRLRPKPFAVLSYLAGRAGRWVSEQELREDALHLRQRHETAIVRVHMSSLRRALGDRAGCIESRRGLGYRFTPPSAPDLTLINDARRRPALLR